MRHEAVLCLWHNILTDICLKKKEAASALVKIGARHWVKDFWITHGTKGRITESWWGKEVISRNSLTVVWAPAPSVAAAPTASSGSNALRLETAAGQREQPLLGASSHSG